MNPWGGLWEAAPLCSIPITEGLIMTATTEKATAGELRASAMSEPLTTENYARIADAIDKDGVFTKDYTQYVGDKVTVVGLRIGEKPNHVVAVFGDTIVRREDGTYTVARTLSGGDRG